MLGDDQFHQEESVQLKLGRTVEPGEVNRILRSLNFKLFYDIYAMERPNKGESWQSETYMDIQMLKEGKEVDAQEACDELRLSYPLATIESSYIEMFARLAEQVKENLDGDLYLDSRKVDHSGIVNHFTACVTELMTEWGEEPGSKSIKFMIESNY